MAMTTIIVLPTHSASTATADALKAACISSTTASMPTVHQVSFRFLLQLSERLGRPLSCLSSGEDDKYLVNDPDPMPSELLQHDDDVSLGDELPSDKDIEADSSGHLEAAYEKSADDAQDEVATVVTAKNDAVSGKKRSRFVSLRCVQMMYVLLLVLFSPNITSVFLLIADMFVVLLVKSGVILLLHLGLEINFLPKSRGETLLPPRLP